MGRVKGKVSRAAYHRLGLSGSLLPIRNIDSRTVCHPPFRASDLGTAALTSDDSGFLNRVLNWYTQSCGHVVVGQRRWAAIEIFFRVSLIFPVSFLLTTMLLPLRKWRHTCIYI